LKYIVTNVSEIMRIIFKGIVLSLTLLLVCASCVSEEKELVDYVNPFIGTAAGGHTFPGACLPFGMVQLSPDTGYQGVRAYSYDEESIIGFSHTHVSGTGPFTKTHYNNVLFMPRVGDLEVLPGVAKELNVIAKENFEKTLSSLSDDERQVLDNMAPNEKEKRELEMLNEEKLLLIDDNNMDEDGYRTSHTYKGYESKYSHDEEEASPGYYAVKLKDYGIKAELTASERAGFHRYTFPESKKSHIVIVVTNSLTPNR
jgi:putative alpha-1,2-mannosidase